MELLRLALVGIFPDSMTKQCGGMLPDGTRCEVRRLNLNRDGLCPTCAQREAQNTFDKKNPGLLSSIFRRRDND
jgi:hypothetical protein